MRAVVYVVTSGRFHAMYNSKQFKGDLGKQMSYVLFLSCNYVFLKELCQPSIIFLLYVHGLCNKELYNQTFC